MLAPSISTREAPAPIGHNSRRPDIERTAREIIEKVRSEWIRPDTNETQRWVTELLCSDLPANAKLYGLVSRLHGDWGDRIFPALDRMQVLTSLSRPTAIKAKNTLVEKGFMKFERKSKGKLSDILKMAFPDNEEHANSKVALLLNGAQQSSSFTVKAVYENATVKNEGSNGKAALPDLSLPFVVAEKEKHTARATGCDFRRLQGEGEGTGFQGEQVQEAELFNASEVPASIGPLPSKEHLQRWDEITRRWGLSPAEELPPRDKLDFKVGQWLKNDVKALGFQMKHEPEIIAAALETTLATMEGKIMSEPEPESRKGAGAAKTWFFKAFGGNLDLLRQREHDARVGAKTVEAEAEIKVNGARRADEMKLGALGTRLDAGNQAAVKRIEAAGATDKQRQAHGNGQAALDDFQDDQIVERVAGTPITGLLCKELLERIPEATGRQIRLALTHAASDLERTNLGNEVKFPDARKVMRIVEKRVLFDVYGKPDDERRCGGPIAIFRDVPLYAGATHGEDKKAKSLWVCLSQPFVDRVSAQHPLTGAELFYIFRELTDGFDRWRTLGDSEYPGLQAKVEAEFEAKAAERVQRKAEEEQIIADLEEERRRQREDRERKKHGVWYTDDGELIVGGEFKRSIDRILAREPIRHKFWESLRRAGPALKEIPPSKIAYHLESRALRPGDGDIEAGLRKLPEELADLKSKYADFEELPL